MYKIRGLCQMGISYNPVYGGFRSTFLVTPTPTLLSQAGALGTFYGRLKRTLIGDFPSPEPFIPMRWSAH
jgi:hypothetical protein